MNGRTKLRLIWGVAAMTIAYALSTVLVYYATGKFNETWLAVSLAAYAGMLLVALILAWTDTSEPASAVAHTTHPVTINLRETVVRNEPPRVSQDVIYRTRTGEAIRSTVGSAGRLRSDFYGVTRRDARPVRAVEAELDGRRSAIPGRDVSAQVERALAARAARRTMERHGIRPTQEVVA